MGAFYAGIKPNSRMKLFYCLAIYAKTFIIAAVIVFSDWFVAGQLIPIQIMNLLMLIMTVMIKPYKKRTLNILAAFNDTIMLSITTLFLTMTDLSPV